MECQQGFHHCSIGKMASRTFSRGFLWRCQEIQLQLRALSLMKNDFFTITEMYRLCYKIFYSIVLYSIVLYCIMPYCVVFQCIMICYVLTLYSSIFKVTFWFPSWRSLKHRKGHLWVQTRSLWRTWLLYIYICTSSPQFWIPGGSGSNSLRNAC